MFKKKIINILTAVAVLLLVVNILTDLFSKPKKENTEKELSVDKIETIFFTVMDDYGIDPKWIQKKRSKTGEDDSTSVYYSIQIPGGTPIPLILRDINKNIDKDVTVVVSEEKKNYGNTEVRIYSNETLKLRALLQPDSKLLRTRNLLSFIIADANDLSADEFKSILSFPYPLALEIYPSEEIIPKLDSILINSKQYIVLLNDEISDNKFKLESDYQRELLRSSVYSISSVFSNSAFILIDPLSALYLSPVYNYVKDEFKKKNRELIPISRLVNLKADTQDELLSKFRFHCEEGNGDKKKIFLLSFEDFMHLKNDIQRVKKKGSRIIFPSKNSFM